MGKGDHSCHEGQAQIATLKARDKNDEVIVQEKLDGSNVGVARIDGWVYALGRSGYLASSSPYLQHQLFADWVNKNVPRFLATLIDGERVVGEWLLQAHGTRYALRHEPFVAFDIMSGDVRMPYDEFSDRVLLGDFIKPYLVHRGDPISVDAVMGILGEYGQHGAIDPIEGAVWRVERDRSTGVKGEKVRVVDFLVKYVRPDKKDGIYLPDVSGVSPHWNVSWL
jgi:hypothetical protein